jgi:hypothetical protein
MALLKNNNEPLPEGQWFVGHYRLGIKAGYRP